MTDTFHKPGFKLQHLILRDLLVIVELGKIAGPVGANENPPQSVPNPQYVRVYIVNMLTKHFPQLTQPVVEAFVTALFASLNSEVSIFRGHVRDFLIRLKEYAEDDADLFLEESEAKKLQDSEAQAAYVSSVPGLAPQYEASARPGDGANATGAGGMMDP